MDQETRAALDPVCGKSVDTLRARAIGIFGGRTYYFCSPECKARFADPRRSERVDDASVAERRSPEPTSHAPAQPAVERPAETPLPDLRVESRGSSKAVSPRAWLLAMALVAVGAIGAWLALRSPVPDQRQAQSATTAPTSTTPLIAPVSAPSPLDLATPSPTRTASGSARPVPPLEIGMRWFVERGTNRMDLVERILVLDAERRVTVHEVARVDMRGDVSTRDGSAPLPPKAGFTASTAASGMIYDDGFASGAAYLDVRVTRRPGALVAEVRSTPGGPWRTTLSLPLAADSLVRGAHFAKKRYEDLPPEPGR